MDSQLTGASTLMMEHLSILTPLLSFRLIMSPGGVMITFLHILFGIPHLYKGIKMPYA